MSLLEIIANAVQTPFSLFCDRSPAGHAKQMFKYASARDLNAAQSAVAINAVNGNAIVCDKKFTVADGGIELSIGQIWNSSDNTWRLSGISTLEVGVKLNQSYWNMVPGYAEKDFVNITEDDGRVVKYILNNGRYECAMPDQQGCSYIVFKDGKWIRSFPDSGLIQTYSNGKMISQEYPAGQKLVYEYRDNKLVSILLPSERRLTLSPDVNHPELVKVDLIEPDKTCKNICSYEMGSSGSLVTRIKQPDETYYTTNYQVNNDGGNQRLTIISDDQTEHQLSFDNRGSMTGLREGKEGESTTRNWSLNQDIKSRQFSVSVDGKTICDISFDAEGNLSTFSASKSSQRMKVVCDTVGRPTEITSQDGNVKTVAYDTVTGLIKKISNSKNKLYTEIIYETDKSSLNFGCMMAKIQGDGNVSAQTTYLYNARRQCVFCISPEGRVQQFVYDDKSPFRKKETRQFTDKIYKGERSAFDQAEWLKQNAEKFIVTRFGYDKYGRLNREDLMNLDAVVTSSVDEFDDFGRLLESNLGGVVANNAYDGLGRVTQSSQGLVKSAEYSVNMTEYLGPISKTTHQNGRIESNTKDSGGLIIANEVKDKVTGVARVDRVIHNNDGSVKMRENADDTRNQNFYSKPGIIKFAVSSEGGVIEYCYDDADRLVGEKKYDVSLSPGSLTLDDVAKCVANCKRFVANYQLKDSQGLVRAELQVNYARQTDGTENLEGTLVEHEYRFKNRVATIKRASKVPENLLDPSKYHFDFNQIVNLPGNLNQADRITRSEFDLDGKEIFVWVQTEAGNGVGGAKGYFTQYEYNAAGLRVAETIYQDSMCFESKPSKDLATRQLKTIYWYDQAGRKIGKLDPDNYFISYEYDENGKIKNEKHHVKQMPAMREAGFSLNNIEESKDDAVVSYEYDTRGREIAIRHSTSHLTVRKIYSNNDLLVQEIHIDDLTQKQREVRKEFNVFGELIAEASRRVCQNKNIVDDKNNWYKHVYNPASGLKTQEVDETGSVKLFYYGPHKKPILNINSLGVVTTIQYDIISGKPTETKTYAEKIDPSTLKKLQSDVSRSGFLSSEMMMSMLPPVTENDRKQVYLYNANGTLCAIENANGSREAVFHNAFGEIVLTRKEIEKNKFLEEVQTHNLRGNVVSQTIDPKGLAISTSAEFNDPLNRCTSTTTALRNKTLTDYEGLRKKIEKDADQVGREKTTILDAFNRPQSETDWTNNNPIIHEYSDSERKTKLKSPVSEDRDIVEFKNAFEEVTDRLINGVHTVFEREVDGKIQSQNNPDGSSESAGYDIRGIKNENTSTLQLKSNIEINSEGKKTGITDLIGGKEIKSSLEYNSFNEVKLETDAEQNKIAHESNVVEDTKTTIKDPDGLHLIEQTKTNFAGHVVEKCEGDKQDPTLYREFMQPDLLGRESKKWIDMGADKKALVHDTKFNNLGQPVEILGANGLTIYHVYDNRSNLRYSLDRGGFLIERTYDANNRETSIRHYAQKMTAEVLKDLPSAIIKSNNDAITYKRYDADGLLTLEVKVIDVISNVVRVAVTQYEYDGMKKPSRTVAYAKTVDLTANPVDTLPALIKTDEFANDPLNRTTRYKRDAMGRVQMIIDGESNLTELKRDLAGNIVAKIQHARKYVENKTMNSQDPENRAKYRIYDKYGNIRFKVDAEGFVREYRYNNAHDLLKRITYVTKLKEIPSSLMHQGLARKSDEILCLLESIVNKIKNDDLDIHEVSLIDKARRIEGKIDGEGGQESYTLNAVGEWTKKTDKCKNVWQRHYHKNKSISLEISPSINVTNVKLDITTNRLTMTNQDQQVESKHELDSALKPSSVILASNIADQSRTLNSIYDENQLIKGTLRPDVKVDDGTIALPDVTKNYHVTKNLTTEVVRDFLGREIVNINERNLPSFTIYDAIGNKRFTISASGTVTEYKYQNGFKEPTQTITYAVAMTDSQLQTFRNGMPIEAVKDFISQIDHDNDRALSCTYDNNGKMRTIKYDKSLVGVITRRDGKLFVDGAEIEPERELKYNNFKEVIAEHHKRALGRPDAVIQHIHDRNGCEIITISAYGYAILRTFGVLGLIDGKKQRQLLSTHEYFKRFTPENRLTKASILEALITNIDPLNDRISTTNYDRRHLVKKTTIASGHPFFVAKSEDSRSIKTQADNPQITTVTFRDAEGHPIAYMNTKGEMRYLINNAMGKPIYETDFPVLLGLGEVGIPVYQHYYNALLNPVGTKQYAYSAHIIANQNHELQLQGLIEESALDSLSLILMCERGLPIATQKSQEGVKFATYNETSQLVRSCRLVSGGEADISQNNRPFRQSELRAYRQAYDNNALVVMRSSFEGDKTFESHMLYNAFSEQIAEGPEKGKYVLFSEYDKRGNKWFTNFDRAIATVSFFDEDKGEVASYRSTKIDLGKIYRNNYAKAFAELLQSNYEITFVEFQRFLTLRNEDGQFLQGDTPWFYRRSSKEPNHLNVQFTVVNHGDQRYIRFNAPDQKILTMEYKIRSKGSKVWDIRTVETLPGVGSEQGMVFVNITDLATNPYEYRLDLFYTGKLSKARDKFPSYRASGEVMLDTGNYLESTQPIWYLKDNHTMVIAGKCQDVSGIEIIRDGVPCKRIAATRQANGSLEVNLEHELVGEYSFKLVMGSHVVADNITIGQGGEVAVNIFAPQFTYQASNQVVPTAATLPAELTGRIRYDFVVGAQPVPNKFGRPGGSYQVGHRNSNFTVGWGTPLTSVFITGVDQHNQEKFLAAYPVVPTVRGHTYWRFSGQNYPGFTRPIQTSPFMLLQNHSGTPIHALSATVNGNPCGNLQVQSWLDGYIACDNIIPYPPANVKLTAISLTNAPVSDLMGTFTLGTLLPGEVIPAEEICVSKLNIERYKVGGYGEGHWWDPCADMYYAYSWLATTQAHHSLRLSHTGVSGAIVSDISSMPLSPSGRNKMFFQTMVPLNQGAVPDNLFLELIKDGDIIPVCIGEKPSNHNGNSRGREVIEQFQDDLSMSLECLSSTSFAEQHIMYYKNMPVGTKKVVFEYLFSSSHDEKIWRSMTCYMTSAGGLSVLINSLPAGVYSCRFKLYDNINVADNDVMKTNDPRFIQDAEGYCHLSMFVKKGVQNGQVFSNKKKSLSLEVVKPSNGVVPDPWNNPLVSIDRTGNKVEKVFNILNQPIKITTLPVKSYDNHGLKKREPLVTENLMNTDGFMVGQINPAKQIKRFLPNSRGQNIMTVDEDGVINQHEYSIMRHCVSNRTMTGNTITSSFTIVDGLLVETRLFMDKTTETITYNEERHPISICNRLGHTTWFKPDAKGRNRLQINPLLQGQTVHSTRVQVFHPRSGATLLSQDEDGNTQVWATDPSSAADTYVGNIASYTDLAGQTIIFTLNCNKQIISEIGHVDDVINEKRGFADTHGTRPPAHKVSRLRDEAGHEIDLIDHGAELTTAMEYDEEDYCTSYYFMGKDGRVYQATNIIFDELHRIHKMLDTHIMIKLGYDETSNRRFAKAYAIGDDGTNIPLDRESWYDYTPAGRVFLRDCILRANEIVMANGQGMKITHESGLVKEQASLTAAGHTLVAKINYNDEDLVKKITSVESGEDVKVEHRLIKMARLKQRVTTKGNKTTVDAFELDSDDTTIHQVTQEIEDSKEISKTDRLVTQKTKSGRTLKEKMRTHVEVGTKDNEGSIDIEDDITTMYVAAGSFTVRAVATDRKIFTHGNARAEQADPEAELQTTQNANGMATSVKGVTAADQKANKDAYREFVVNSENCVLLKETQNGRNYYFYAQKTPGKTVLMAYFGDLSDSTMNALKRGEALRGDQFNPAVFNIDVNHQPLSANYPAPYPGRFNVPRDMTYNEIADELNYTGFGPMIAQANSADATEIVTAGTPITIPPLYFEVPETAWNGSMPGIESLLGSMYPALAAPHISLRPARVNWLETMVEVAAGAAIMIFAPYAFAAMMGYTLSAASSLVVAASYGAAAATANATTQGIAMAFGSQQHFDFKSMATQAVAAAVTAGVASKATAWLNGSHAAAEGAASQSNRVHIITHK